MSMNVNIYLPEELGERVKKADLEVSRICQVALAREVDNWEANKAAKGKGPFGRIEVKVGDGSRPTITKVFSGRWLVTDYMSEEHTSVESWSIALTKGGRFAVYTEGDAGGLQRTALAVYESLAEAYEEEVPEDVLAEAAAKLGISRVIHLDI
jgi:hypothetical protein